MVQKTTLHLVVRVKFPVACTVTAELMLDYDVSYTIIIILLGFHPETWASPQLLIWTSVSEGLAT